jgi:hypothetical protein
MSCGDPTHFDFGPRVARKLNVLIERRDRENEEANIYIVETAHDRTKE